MNDRLPHRGFVNGVVLGMLLFGVFMALGIWITVRIPVALNPAPISYLDPQLVGPSELCPGDLLSVHSGVEFNRPAIVTTFLALRNAGTGRNVPNTLLQLPVRMQPAPVQFDDTYSMTLPLDLEPGSYEYMRFTIAVNMDAEPAYLVLPFTVEACP